MVALSSYFGSRIFNEIAFLKGNESYRFIIGAIAGAVLGLLVVAIEIRLSKITLKTVAFGAVGLLVGLIVCNAIINTICVSLGVEDVGKDVYPVAYLVCAYLGLMLAAKKAHSTTFSKILPFLGSKSEAESYKILDTSVIIDGRIYDICETDFLEGVLIVPQFVLRELQHIADSSDSLKRNRGRRGLDVLNKLQKLNQIEVRVVENDYPKIPEVDSKLVALARDMGAKILTNDFNLNKVAELQGVSVLNINLLANALKPVVLPGEIMKVYLIKEGKESGQAVAYLDDGTMVVVDNARDQLGSNVDVTVTSVLQTTAGRMIFGKLKESDSYSESDSSKKYEE
ncbi:MAG: PIN domain nuclease [Candidatus Schekmanbacteria bacterium]|nr:MAG: PIN domain nuclease [Candidatus Schekmanbacteria bacterium]